jgi:hypothetical protein
MCPGYVPQSVRQPTERGDLRVPITPRVSCSVQNVAALYCTVGRQPGWVALRVHAITSDRPKEQMPGTALTVLVTLSANPTITRVEEVIT